MEFKCSNCGDISNDKENSCKKCGGTKQEITTLSKLGEGIGLIESIIWILDDLRR